MDKFRNSKPISSLRTDQPTGPTQEHDNQKGRRGMKGLLLAPPQKKKKNYFCFSLFNKENF